MRKIHPIPSKITIVTATNNGFAIMAAALFKSIEINCTQHNDYQVYVLGDRLNDKNKSRILQSSRLSIEFIEISNQTLSDIELPDKVDYLPKTAYFRLMIPELFMNFKKVIYLDVDTLVLTDLRKLWEISLEDKLCLACESSYAQDHHGLDYFRIMGLDTKAPYFNSGVLVIDIQRWREENIRQRVTDLLNTTLNKPKVMDEEGLNVVLFDKWKCIDQKWNFPPHLTTDNAMPYVLHFIGYKPIFNDYKGRHQELFYKYLTETAWEGKKPYGLVTKAVIKFPRRLKVFFKKLSAYNPLSDFGRRSSD